MIHKPYRMESDLVCNFNCGCDVCEQNSISDYLFKEIKFITVDHIPYHRAAQISSSLTQIVSIYTR